MRYVALIILLLLAVLLPSGLGNAQTTPAPVYLKTFDNYAITSPTALLEDAELGIVVESRDRSTWRSLEPMAAEHGAMCEAPPATHQLTGSYDEAVFLCGGAGNQHVMTSLYAEGYGVIYLTPGALADFGGGETVVRFDASTLRNSQRDWLDLWFTPFEDAMALPLDDWLPDMQGVPRRAVHLRMDTTAGDTIFRAERIDGQQAVEIPGVCTWSGCGYEHVLTPSAAVRSTFELAIDRTHVRMSLVSSTTRLPILTWIDADIPDLGWSSGIVQIGHHSYNPMKDCAVPAGTPGCRPGTWHLDNLSISATSPLTMIPATNRWATEASPTYTFPSGAPDGAVLDVAAVASTLDASFDGGASWAPMVAQNRPAFHWGGRSSYRIAAPAGTVSVMLRGTEQTGQWDASHAAIMSRAARPKPPTPTLLPTQTPVPTATPIPPTNTPGPTDTPQPIPTATDTPAPVTSTPLPPIQAPTMTSGPPVSCEVQVVLNGTPGPLRDCR